MKKFASILLIVLYATSSSGASFHFHFCMGKFRGIGIGAAKNQTCEKCGMKKGGNGCCSDVMKTFKVFNDQSSSPIGFDFTQYPFTLPPTGSYSSRTPLFVTGQPILFPTGPPEPPQLPLFIRDCNFRI